MRCQKIEKSVLDELVTDTIKYVCPPKITKVRVVSVGELFGEAIRRVTNEEPISNPYKEGKWQQVELSEIRNIAHFKTSLQRRRK